MVFVMMALLEMLVRVYYFTIILVKIVHYFSIIFLKKVVLVNVFAHLDGEVSMEIVIFVQADIMAQIVKHVNIVV